MAENKVQFGLKNVHYAKRVNGVAGTVKSVNGAVTLALSAQGETNKFFADNIAYYVTQSNQGYSGDLEMAHFPDEMRRDLWGEVLEATDKVQYELSNVEPAVFDLGFQIDGDENETLVWIYGCTASRPAVGSSTINENKEVKTETCTITSSPLANGLVRSFTTDSTTSAVRSAWFTTVYEPTIS